MTVTKENVDFLFALKKELTKVPTLCYNSINRLSEKGVIYPYYLTTIIIQSNVEMSSPF